MAGLAARVGKLEADIMPEGIRLVLFKCFDDAEITGLEWDHYGYERLKIDRRPGETVEALKRRAVEGVSKHAMAVGCELNGIIALAEVCGATVA